MSQIRENDMIKTIEKPVTLTSTVFVTSDGKEFVPYTKYITTAAELERAIINAKNDAETHQNEIDRREKNQELLKRLFGDRAEEVAEAMDVGGMRTLCRRWYVLKTLDAVMEAKKEGKEIPKSPLY